MAEVSHLGMKRRVYILMITIVLLPIWLATPRFASSANVVQTIKHGQIDWTNRIIEAAGVAYCDRTNPDQAQARAVAKRKATERARSSLLSVIKAIPIDSSATVSSWLTRDSSKLESLLPYLKKAELADISFGKRDEVRVTLSLRFDGKLADLLLPEYIKKIEPITQSGSSGQSMRDGHTGILLDCRGIGFKPCLVPRIVNERNEEVFGPAYVSRECVVKGGMVKYLAGEDSSTERMWVGQRPLRLKALRVLKNMPCVVVLTNADAERLRGDPANFRLFHNCKVVFLVK